MRALAFRIRDFRSIKDSGEFSVSGDNVTVLAGQNEAGKTTVLLALREFDRSLEKTPETKEFMPEGDFDALPRVAVQFRLEEGDAEYLRKEESFPEFWERFVKLESFWIERHLLTGTITLDARTEKIWDEAKAARSAVKSNDTEDAAEQAQDVSATPSKEAIIEALYGLWPYFLYFDAFQDVLPRQVDVDDLLNKESTSTVPETVRDFLQLANIDPAKIDKLRSDDKTLGNYLDRRGVDVTRDFLTYWQQRVDGDQHLQLKVSHQRDESGRLKLAFYVRDDVNQYPEQRSKGFLWFLSFYLRLAAAQRAGRVLLIDEPGSYLHARAQRNVLDLFESRIAQQNQVIFSSHSPFLMPAHTLHRVRVVVKTRERGTRVYDRLTHPELRGQDFADTLTPLVQAIGINISQAFTFHRPKNLLVEGITDHIYLTNWAQLFMPTFNDEVNVMPGFGATSLPTLASLFIGWGQHFAVLLDRDEEGNKMRDRFAHDFLVSEQRIIQPNGAMVIEDMFSAEDFRTLLEALDPTLTLISSEKPSAAIKRQSIDKVLLARTYAERASRGEMTLSDTTEKRIGRLLTNLLQAASYESGN